MKLIKNLLLLLIVCHSTIMQAKTLPQWEIVPAQSSITFTGTQNNAQVTGAFKSYTGTIFADPANYQESNIDMVINMNSLAVTYAELATILITPDWFNVKAFPTAEFKSTKLKKIDDKTYEAVGTLTIKDKSIPMTLTFTATESPKNNVTIEGHTTFKRSTFGVGVGEWASTDEVKDDVTVNFKLLVVPKI